MATARTLGRVAAGRADPPGMPAALARRYWRLLGDARVVLDLGCGAGDLGRTRPHPGVDVYGVDRDATALERAARYERTFAVDLDRDPLPFADAMFDAALAKDILEHVDDPLAVAREVHRVLRPGGILLASVVMARPSRLWDDYTHKRGFTARSARRLLEDAGFVVEDIWRMGGVPGSARLAFIDAVPALLRVPLFDALWGASWELRAVRP
jgi:SAM-dependent methyltransferase